MSDITYNATIERVERRNNSPMGNPSWMVYFFDHKPALTMADTMWSYEADNPEWKGAEVTVTATRAGRIRWCTHAITPRVIATYTEYAVMVADGPSEGYILKTLRNREQAQRIWSNRRNQMEEKLVIRKRTVT